MSTSIFPDDIVYVGESDFNEGPHTPGQPRQTAYETDGLWVGITRVTARDVPSQWHHHADHDSPPSLDVTLYMFAASSFKACRQSTNTNATNPNVLIFPPMSCASNLYAIPVANASFW